MQRALLAGLSLTILTVGSFGQTGTVRGFVVDGSSGQGLPGANVALFSGETLVEGTVTDREGIFLIPRVPFGTYVLQASFVGFESYRTEITVNGGRSEAYRVPLRTTAEFLGEVVVEGEKTGGATGLTAGVHSIRPADIKLIPAPDISGDLATYLTAMPGVVSTGDRGGQLYIRGGEPTSMLILMDGVPVFQPFHLLGFYSAFASDLIASADVHTGGFSSKYSGRVGSVIDVQSRNGNNQMYRRGLSLSPFVNHAMLEGPLIKGRASFLASVRQSVIDRAASKYVGAPLPFAFGDLFGKAHAVLSNNHQLSVTALRTYDRGSLSGKDKVYTREEIRWHNTAFGARYVVLPSSLPMFAEVVAFGSRLDMELGPRLDPTRMSSMEDIGGSVNLTSFAPKVTTAWGFYLRHIELKGEIGGLYQDLDVSVGRSTNAGAYIEPDFEVIRGLSFRPGVSVRYYGRSGTSIEPRVRAVWTRAPHEFSAAAGVYRQEIVGLQDRRDVTNVFTVWTESPVGDLQHATQQLLGYRFTGDLGLDLSAEVYHTRLDHLSVTEWTAFPRFTTRLQSATGEVYGLDLRMEMRRRSFYGFLNYGLSSVRYTALNEDITFRPPHDRRHQINALGTFTAGGIDFSVRWQLGSGLPYTRVRGFDTFIYMDGPTDVSKSSGTPRVIYDKPFGGLLPAFHRLDISAQHVFRYGEDSFVTVQAGIMNVYDRSNLFALDLFTLRQIDQIPFMPTVGVKFEF